MEEFVKVVTKELKDIKAPPSEAEIAAQFEALDAEKKGSLQIKPTLQLLIGADKARRAKETEHVQACAKLKAGAFELQQAAKQAVAAHLQKEAEAAAALAAVEATAEAPATTAAAAPSAAAAIDTSAQEAGASAPAGEAAAVDVSEKA